jgi:Holliday junction DNA helicase RuvA
MIAQISGEPVLAGDRWVVIDVHGVGYRVQVTQPALQQLADRQETVKLYTHMAVREDAITLYGFLHQSELEMFRILISVTGIGPQIAMNLLNPDLRYRDEECKKADPGTQGQDEEDQ